MKDLTSTPHCERSDQLISFLYDETDERESLEFKSHLRGCSTCQAEVASFGQLRESIGEWRDETVGRFAVPQLAHVVVRKKSALVALREFFDLSPLWLKGAVGFATVLFVVMLVLTAYRTQPKPNQVVASEVKYTRDQVDQIVKDALNEQASTFARSAEVKPREEIVKAPIAPAPKRTTVRKDKTRPSLSKSEREQLAADLRLLRTEEETSLNLLGDRINQEF